MNTVQMKDISRVAPSFDGKLVHATGRADTKDMLRDPVFGVGKVAVKLNRNVEYYQWRESSRTEKRKKVGGGEETVTTYTYQEVWTGSPIDSNNFKDPDYIGINEVLAGFQDEQWVAPTVSFGAYMLPGFLKNGIEGTASSGGTHGPAETGRSPRPSPFPGATSGCRAQWRREHSARSGRCGSPGNIGCRFR